MPTLIAFQDLELLIIGLGRSPGQQRRIVSATAAAVATSRRGVGLISTFGVKPSSTASAKACSSEGIGSPMKRGANQAPCRTFRIGGGTVAFHASARTQIGHGHLGLA